MAARERFNAELESAKFAKSRLAGLKPGTLAYDAQKWKVQRLKANELPASVMRPHGDPEMMQAYRAMQKVPPVAEGNDQRSPAFVEALRAHLETPRARRNPSVRHELKKLIGDALSDLPGEEKPLMDELWFRGPPGVDGPIPRAGDELQFEKGEENNFNPQPKGECQWCGNAVEVCNWCRRGSGWNSRVA